jgi:demethylmenaquinone methyltransferase/2-methoxy-6-polyprenyl-1,4-benzoquinol methylase
VSGHGTITETARELFAPLGRDYDRWAAILSFGQDPLWRRFLVQRVPVGRDARVLDVATGTASIARALVRAYGCSVVGVDQSPEMLAGARARIVRAGLADRIELQLGSADSLDLPEASFDGLTAGYLLRYVDDPLATMTRLLRAIRPGAPFALLDFGVPPNAVARALWQLYTRVGLPVLGRLVSPGWADVGRYLRPSITAFDARYPPQRLRALCTEAGGAGVQVRRLSLGGGVVVWGVRAGR